MTAIVFYFQVHQPYRLNPYKTADVGTGKPWFDDDVNRQILAELRSKPLPLWSPLTKVRERLERLGPQALTSAELLAILLRTGTAAEDVLRLASRLLAEHRGLRGLASTDVPVLRGAHGLGAAKAATRCGSISRAVSWRP